jgi:hypothetical protein
MLRRKIPPLAVAGAIGTLMFEHAAASPQAPGPGMSSRRATAVTYDVRRTSRIALAGTLLLPRSRGEAEVDTTSSGPVRIRATVHGMTTASQFGPEYLTFVLWAIPPQGRAQNLGELRIQDGEARIAAATGIQSFALIVTAEPYYAVTSPSEVVVMENLVSEETRGRTSIAVLEYEIVPHGGYAPRHLAFPPAPLKAREPIDVQQARNAITIAYLADSMRFAPQSLAMAERLLQQVEALVAGHGSNRDIVARARAAVETAEEARLLSTIARTSGAGSER